MSTTPIMRLTAKIVTIALAALATLAGAASAHAAPRTVSVINGAGPNDWSLSQTQIRGFEPAVVEDCQQLSRSGVGRAYRPFFQRGRLDQLARAVTRAGGCSSPALDSQKA